MKKTLALAACAALSLAVAACGDDDDDASGATTELTTAEVADTAADDSDASDTAAETDASGDADATEPPASVSGEDADLLADCTEMQTVFAESTGPDTPEIGDEITDEYRDAVNEQIGLIEDVDLNTDLAQDAREALVDWAREQLEGDTYTEEMDNAEPPSEVNEFGVRCSELISAASGG